MTTPDTICFGTLFKTGGKGHTVRNQKLRWCVLQGTFLTYYFEKPDLSGKAFDKLKGQLYLEGCQIRDADQTEPENSFVITNSSGKEYIFTPTIDKEECTMWKNAIFYALKKVKIFADNLSGEPLAAGWLMKKGGKGHKTQNWKKRYFVLQGQFLNYFDRVNARPDDLTGLKGWINLTEITELSNDEDTEDGCEKPHYLKIITTNEKGYFLVAKNDEEKKQWFFRLKRQLDLFVKTYELPQTNLVIEEKEVKSGFLSRLSGSEWRKTWVVLTNLNIRFYKGDARKTPTDLGKQLFETIRLVGISLEEVKGKGKDNSLKLVDVLGNTYTLAVAESAEFKPWVEAVKKAASTLVTTIITKGESISINCRTSPDDANDKTKRQEYTQVKLTRDTLSFFFLLSNARVDIPLKNIDKVSDAGGVFYMKYQLDDKPQELRVKSSNVQGLFSTINTVLEIYREKNKPITEPVRPSEHAEEFTFENTYLSDSFFEKMERDMEEANLAANAAVEKVGEAVSQANTDQGSNRTNEQSLISQVQKLVDAPKHPADVQTPAIQHPMQTTFVMPKPAVIPPPVGIPKPVSPQKLIDRPKSPVELPSPDEAPRSLELDTKRPEVTINPVGLQQPTVALNQNLVDVPKPAISVTPVGVQTPVDAKQLPKQPLFDPKPTLQTPNTREPSRSVERNGAPKPLPRAPVPRQDTSTVPKPPQPKFVPAVPKYMKEAKKPVGWVDGRRPVEEKLPPPSMKDLPNESSPPQSIEQKDIVGITAAVVPMSTSPEVLQQEALELMLVKTHQKSSEHLSLASEMDIDISNIRDSYMTDSVKGATKSPRTNSNPIHRAFSDYSFRNSDGESAVYGISDLDEIVDAEEDENGRFIITNPAVYKPNPASLEPTVTTDMSDSVCSSMTNSLVFKPDDGTSSMTSTYENNNNNVANNNVQTDRLVIIKNVTLPSNNTNILQSSNLSASNSSPTVNQSPLRDSVDATDTSTGTSSGRHSIDYENIYSSITYDTLTPVGSVTNDALAHIDKSKAGSKTSLEAQIALQSIEKFLDTAPVIGSVPPDTVITPRPNFEQEEEQPKQDLNLYASLDNLLKETEDMLRQAMQD